MRRSSPRRYSVSTVSSVRQTMRSGGNIIFYHIGSARHRLPIGRRLRHHHMIIGQFSEAPMPKARKARAVGFNHVALEVGDIEEALAFYGRLFDFKLRGKSK